LWLIKRSKPSPLPQLPLHPQGDNVMHNINGMYDDLFEQII